MNEIGHGLFSVDLKYPTTNLVFIIMDKSLGSAVEFVQRLSSTNKKEIEAIGDEIILDTVEFTDQIMRISIHLDITDEMAKSIEKKLRFVIGEYLRK